MLKWSTANGDIKLKSSLDLEFYDVKASRLTQDIEARNLGDYGYICVATDPDGTGVGTYFPKAKSGTGSETGRHGGDRS